MTDVPQGIVELEGLLAAILNGGTMASSPEQEIPQEIIDKAYRAYRAATDRSPLGAAIAAVLSDLQRPLLEEIERERETRKALAQIADRRKTERDTRPDLTVEEEKSLVALVGDWIARYQYPNPNSQVWLQERNASLRSARAKLERSLDAH